MKRILVTGGAGFIGSNIVEALLSDSRIGFVCVLDNLSTGSEKNIAEFIKNPKFKFIEGDIRDYETCRSSVKDIDAVCHQAALGSVPRSIKDPKTTNEVNVSGTLNVYNAAKEEGIKKIVYASSSSVYGDNQSLPKVEHSIGKPLSPYAITKYVTELYANVFHQVYDMDFIGLRYFNVYGPKQSPTDAYAAVMPLFIKAMLQNTAPIINGDGTNSRDFTYVSNVVQANIRAIFCEDSPAWNRIYNIAVGQEVSILEVYNLLSKISGSKGKPIHGPERVADIKHSLADISEAKKYLKYSPAVFIEEGLKYTFDWLKSTSI